MNIYSMFFAVALFVLGVFMLGINRDIAYILIPFSLFFGYAALLKGRSGGKRGRFSRKEKDFLRQQYDALARMELPRLPSSQLLLEEGELLHFSFPAARVAVGSAEKFTAGQLPPLLVGRLLITNQRIVFFEPSSGFVCPHSQVLGATASGDYQVDIQSADGGYSVIVPDHSQAVRAIVLVHGQSTMSAAGV